LYAGCGSLNQSRWQVQGLSQAHFTARHLSIIAFVIVPRQMQYSMEHQDLNLVSGGMSEAARILSCNFGGDG
jgi:hypothetical protein